MRKEDVCDTMTLERSEVRYANFILRSVEGAAYCSTLVSIFPLQLSAFLWNTAMLLAVTGCMCTIGISMYHRKRHIHRFGRIFAAVSMAMAVVLLLCIIYASWIEPRLLFQTNQMVQFPLQHPVKIVVVSDMLVESDADRSFIERMVRAINDTLPDIVLIAGNMTKDGTANASQIRALQPLRNIHAAFGTFAVLGNVDHAGHAAKEEAVSKDSGESMSAFLRSCGFVVLNNAATTVNLGTESIMIAGVDDASIKKANLDLAFAHLRPEIPLILLSHSPDIVKDARSARAQLIVAGGTLGGQVRLPFFGRILPPRTQLGAAYDRGLFRIDEDSSLVISSGIGTPTLHARFLAPPEILVLTLKAPSRTSMEFGEGRAASEEER